MDTVDEASGYLVLGDSFATILSAEFDIAFKYHPQRQGCKNSNPGSTDSAIIHRLATSVQTSVYYVSDVPTVYQSSRLLVSLSLVCDIFDEASGYLLLGDLITAFASLVLCRL